MQLAGADRHIQLDQPGVGVVRHRVVVPRRLTQRLLAVVGEAGAQLVVEGLVERLRAGIVRADARPGVAIRCVDRRRAVALGAVRRQHAVRDVALQALYRGALVVIETAELAPKLTQAALVLPQLLYVLHLGAALLAIYDKAALTCCLGRRS